MAHLLGNESTSRLDVLSSCFLASFEWKTVIFEWFETVKRDVFSRLTVQTDDLRVVAFLPGCNLAWSLWSEVWDLWVRVRVIVRVVVCDFIPWELRKHFVLRTDDCDNGEHRREHHGRRERYEEPRRRREHRREHRRRRRHLYMVAEEDFSTHQDGHWAN